MSGKDLIKSTLSAIWACGCLEHPMEWPDECVWRVGDQYLWPFSLFLVLYRGRVNDMKERFLSHEVVVGCGPVAMGLLGWGWEECATIGTASDERDTDRKRENKKNNI